MECEDYLGIDTEVVSIPMTHLEARKSSIGEFAGRGLYAAQNIPQGSTFEMNESGVKSFHVLPSTWSIIRDLHEWADDNDDEYVFVQDELSSVVTFTDGM